VSCSPGGAAGGGVARGGGGGPEVFGKNGAVRTPVMWSAGLLLLGSAHQADVVNGTCRVWGGEKYGEVTAFRSKCYRVG
jgi:hypothetical protein